MPIPALALVVDDEAHVRAFASKLLREVGVTECLEAGDYSEGQQKYRNEKPGVVLLDSHFPGGHSGLDLLSSIRKDDPDTYVIMFTCEAAASAVMAAIKAGADGYIRKDTPSSRIVAELREIFTDDETEDGT